MKTDKTASTEDMFDFFVQLHLTERCNLSCTHCYQEERVMTEMGLPEIDGALRDISDTIGQWSDTYEIPFTTSFNITGGEPLLRKDLPEILQKISARNFKSYLLTNGVLIKREDARMLADLPISGVQVSLEGSQAIHESIRGKNSFSFALRGVRHLLDAGIAVTLNVTLSEINEACFPDMVSLAADLGVRRLGFSRLVPYGRGLSLLQRMLGKEKLKEVYERIFSINIPGIEILTGDPVAAQLGSETTARDGDAPASGGCAAGVSGITVLPDGTITPCRRLGIPIGNIQEHSLREIWATSPVLDALRDKNAYKGKCRTCERWSECRGCRAIAYAYSLSRGRNDFLEEDPQCFIE